MKHRTSRHKLPEVTANAISLACASVPYHTHALGEVKTAQVAAEA
jgi:hypothetical protein